MAETTADTAASTLEGGTYEILRQRLQTHASELRTRLHRLNEDRKAVFGSIDRKLLTTERISTEHNCIPRDMVATGNRLLFGYNVQFGLKSERHISDVFAVYTFSEESQQLHPASLDLLSDSQFEKDFQDLYRYYKNATFSRFYFTRTHLYMVFQVGKSAADMKSFKWALTGESLIYVDNRSDHEVRYPPQHEFTWMRTTRDMHRPGLHPHISIEDRIFVETVGGDLTIKIENNTQSGAGIYSEPVDDADQTLDDAEISYATVGNCLLLRIRPYKEQAYRYIVYNEKMQQARRIDALRDACVLLPDDHGLIFSNGYYLQTGEHKMFESDLRGLLFDRRIVSPNGEDTLYVFHQPDSGVNVLLGYNMIEQQVETPVVCHGFTMFHGGEMVLFKSQDLPQKHHAIQIWQTPYVGPDYIPEQTTDSYLYKIGNRDIVRGMSECHELIGLIDKDDSYSGLYVDLVRQATDILDSYFWIGEEAAANLRSPLSEIRSAARSAVDEFEKVAKVRRNTQTQTEQLVASTREALNTVGRRRFDKIDEFVQSLAQLRSLRGEIISLRDLRYVDLELVEQLEQQVEDSTLQLSQRCVQFLLQPTALQTYEQRIGDQSQRIAVLTKVTQARELDEHIATTARELEMLIEIVSNLRIDDATQRTSIVDNISAIFTQVNAARAGLKRKSQELSTVEGAAEFSSQLKLLNQSVVNWLDICDTPEKCEEFLTKLMVQIEELEGQFAELDEFVIQLAEKRDEVSGAFESRRAQLVEQRNKRASALGQAADRILKGIKSRVSSLTTINEIHGYFASDLMIDKVRNLVRQLQDLDDTVKADDIQSRLKSLQEDAVRQLKDKQELFEEGANVLRFGKHRFSVNTQVLDLTTVQRDGQICLHLTGTNFYEPLRHPELTSARAVWDMEVVSENHHVYRGEYLAYKMLTAQTTWPADAELLPAVQQFMSPRYAEGYTKGVHDHDAAILLAALRTMQQQAGLLRFSPVARAVANDAWKYQCDGRTRKQLESRLTGFGMIAQLFPATEAEADYIAELVPLLWGYYEERNEGPTDDARRASALTQINEAATYLFAELSDPHREARGGNFVVSQSAVDLQQQFLNYLQTHGAEQRFQQSMSGVAKDPIASCALARDWVQAYLNKRRADSGEESALDSYVPETALLLIEDKLDDRRIVKAHTERELQGLAGTHPVIGAGGTYSLKLHSFMARLRQFEEQTVPEFQQFHQFKSQLVDEARELMKLSEFQPRVLSSFVRNTLIDEVYLPLIGDNLAKQIGTAGEAKRTDRQGLLLLISPPGYGKTTLMEYIANRLGIIFMKINGPAIGHQVTSLDPASALNAGAREEVQKLNLALEMGDNVMIYLDDIQHCHPEFLQKFISLCDAQRKIEGVWKGKTRTYDFRGKKVAVVMAGNPYTESGEKFQIPDMLANRADIYNLGEIIGDSATAFEMSYLENSLTSNPVLARLAARSQQDVYAVIKLAERARRGDAAVGGIDMEGSYSLEELNEFVGTMTRLMRVRDVVLRVNREYILSAAQHDDYRTEPPFLLQGSYRNMNRIAEKVLPVMNDNEVESLIVSSYQNDAQTLTTGTEANLLKFKDLFGKLNPEEQQRWDEIRRTFRQNVKLRGLGSDDKIGQVIATLSTFNDGLESIRQAMSDGIRVLSSQASQHTEDRVADTLAELSSELTQQLTSLSTVVRESGWRPASPAHPDSQSESGSVSSDSPDRLTIVNRLPKTVMNILEAQFDLMHGWLKPLTEMTATQTDELRSLRRQVEGCLQHYRVLLQKLEAAHDQDMDSAD